MTFKFSDSNSISLCPIAVVSKKRKLKCIPQMPSSLGLKLNKNRRILSSYKVKTSQQSRGKSCAPPQTRSIKLPLESLFLSGRPWRARSPRETRWLLKARWPFGAWTRRAGRASETWEAEWLGMQLIISVSAMTRSSPVITSQQNKVMQRIAWI